MIGMTDRFDRVARECTAYDAYMQHLLVALIALLLAGGCEATPSQPPPLASININTATVKELVALPGIGEKHARSIIASRNARGGQFNSLDEIVQIDGIGPATVDKMRPYVFVGPPKR
jgi:competence ComEA-like helix-hairpin-helix protein